MRTMCPPDDQDNAYGYVRLTPVRLELSENFGYFIVSHVYISIYVCMYYY